MFAPKSSCSKLGNKTNSSVTEIDPIPEKRGRKTILGQTKNAGVAISLSQLEAFSSSSSAITPFIGHSPVAWQRQLSQEEREGNPRKTERCCKAAIRLNFAEIRSLGDRRRRILRRPRSLSRGRQPASPVQGRRRRQRKGQGGRRTPQHLQRTQHGAAFSG